jgi:hypothetical protein
MTMTDDLVKRTAKPIASQELTIAEQAQVIADKKLSLLRAVLANRRKERDDDSTPERLTHEI